MHKLPVNSRLRMAIKWTIKWRQTLVELRVCLTITLIRWPLNREPEREDRPFSQLALHRDRALVQVHNRLDDGQPEPRSLRVLRARRIDAVEAIKDFRKVFRSDARA